MKDPLQYNAEVRKAWLPLWVRNAAANWSFMEAQFRKDNFDLRNLPRGEGPCLIVGSGPSLDDCVPAIKDWEGAIFCSTSQLGLFEYLKRDPTYCVYIDADPSMTHLLTPRFQSSECTTTLLTHPQMPSEVFHLWGGQQRYFRMFDPGDSFSKEYLPLMYQAMNFQEKRGIQSYVLNGGCVANAMIALAQSLGYSPIILVGYDLGYPDKQRRFRNYIQDEEGTWKREEMEMLPPERPVFHAANGILTDELQVFYKLSFMILWGLSAPNLLSCSQGILYEVPFVPFREVLESQGRGLESKVLHPLQTYRTAQAYLRQRQIQILKTKDKVMTQNMFDKPWHVRQWEWTKGWWADRYARQQARKLKIKVA
jgi:hypothetical protein